MQGFEPLASILILILVSSKELLRHLHWNLQSLISLVLGRFSHHSFGKSKRFFLVNVA
jgi:hypothetical protein